MGKVVPEQLEIDDAFQPLHRVALGGEILQTLIHVEKPGRSRITAPHRPTTPSPHETLQTATFLEVFSCKKE